MKKRILTMLILACTLTACATEKTIEWDHSLNLQSDPPRPIPEEQLDARRYRVWAQHAGESLWWPAGTTQSATNSLVIELEPGTYTVAVTGYFAGEEVESELSEPTDTIEIYGIVAKILNVRAAE